MVTEEVHLRGGPRHGFLINVKVGLSVVCVPDPLPGIACGWPGPVSPPADVYKLSLYRRVPGALLHQWHWSVEARRHGELPPSPLFLYDGAG